APRGRHLVAASDRAQGDERDQNGSDAPNRGDPEPFHFRDSPLAAVHGEHEVRYARPATRGPPMLHLTGRERNEKTESQGAVLPAGNDGGGAMLVRGARCPRSDGCDRLGNVYDDRARQRSAYRRSRSSTDEIGIAPPPGSSAGTDRRVSLAPAEAAG